jgi:hypothetical protein
MARPFERLSHEWLRLPATIEFLDELRRSDDNILKARKVAFKDAVLTKKGRYGGGTWFSKIVTMEYGRWLSPAKFPIWMYGRFNEMERQLVSLSQITPESMLSNPDFAIQVFTTLKEERQARQLAEKGLVVMTTVIREKLLDRFTG